ncbi:MAG: hypothetical protein ACKV22_21695 [Bryobacteraceae bacterium]
MTTAIEEAAPSFVVDCGDAGHLERSLEALPNRPAVFTLWPREGPPHLARTAQLRRRLLRLLGARASRLANVRGAVARVDCWITGSSLESLLRHYVLAATLFPDSYRDLVRLRMPAYVKVILDNPFPRTLVTTQITRGNGRWFGPFPSRAAAERFETEVQDLFQLRRCQEDLIPSPSHPGCIYGEMGKCLRPCQEVVGVDEYRHEADRVVHFFETGGRSLLDSVAAARDRFSAELDFEQAARQHKRLEQIEAIVNSRGLLAADIDCLYGVAVTASREDGCVDLRLVGRGVWAPVERFAVAAPGDHVVSMDQRLREWARSVVVPPASPRVRQDHLAILSRWVHSSWRDGEWIAFYNLEALPYRKLVRAISRTAAARANP